ncbi:hypothetical protein [Homoserinibacter sp. YIM 151385]|uniref:hypothetical protein n=1 Tax=Homoserinibacter sp. YIM 151385 TaxID=2985506 RepID=UPI0022F0757C|nr:hypothetical protein [Homoserinibacter sp. YIM 151385]WBU37264.1 hypothetical protein OF852_10100 [Homoserinibacter sp. YIM 151385]
MSRLPEAGSAGAPASSVAPGTAWSLVLARGILALAMGLLVTFTADHSWALGGLALAIYALSGVPLLLAIRRDPLDAATRPLRLAHAVATLLVLVAALASLALPGSLLWIAIGFALVTGALELAAGLRGRGRVHAARDWVVAGGLTLLLGLALLLVPADLAQPFVGDEGNRGVLTSALFVAGLLGAWGVLLGVLLSISAVSLRGDARPAAASAPEPGA